MTTKTNLILAAAAAVALALTACGGATPTTSGSPSTTPPATSSAPADPTTSAPAVDPTTSAPVESTPAPDPTTQSSTPESTMPNPSGDLPFAEGPVDPAQFGQLYVAAMKTAKTITVTVDTGGVADSKQYMDMADPNNPKLYSVAGSGQAQVEVVSYDKKAWTRIGGTGQWRPVATADLQGANTDWESTAKSFDKVTLVSAAGKKFDISLKLEGMQQGVPVTMWLDDDNRAKKMEVRVGQMKTVSTYEYDLPVEIPTVK